MTTEYPTFPGTGPAYRPAIIRVVLVALALAALPGMSASQLLMDVSAARNDDLTGSAALLFSNGSVQAGLEHFNGFSSTVAGAVTLRSAPLAPAVFATARGDLEAKLLFSPLEGLGILAGLGRRDGGSAGGDETVSYLAPELVIGGEFNNRRMLAIGLEAVHLGEDTRLGALGAVNVSGWFAGASRVWEGWRAVAGFVNRDAPAARVFVIDQPGFRRTEFLATLEARGLGNFDAMQALRGRRHNRAESTALGNLNPLRFAGGDVDGRGRNVVIGATHLETAASTSLDVELDKYLRASSWLGIGYRDEDDGVSSVSFLKVLAGYTPDFRYALGPGDTKIRLELLWNLEGGTHRALVRFIHLF
jgi:hypothetical protein